MANIEHHLREFGTWLAAHQPEVASCADLERRHIEGFKAWLAGHVGPVTSSSSTGPCRGLWTTPQPRRFSGHRVRIRIRSPA